MFLRDADIDNGDESLFTYGDLRDLLPMGDRNGSGILAADIALNCRTIHRLRGRRRIWLATRCSSQAERTSPGRTFRNAETIQSLGAGIWFALWADEGFLTFEVLPTETILPCASIQSGSSGVSWLQWARAASSHQSSSFGMARRWGPDIMNPRMEASSFHDVRVQYPALRSRKNLARRFPSERLA